MAMAYATVSFAFLDLSQSEAGIALGANAADTPEIVAGAALHRHRWTACFNPWTGQRRDREKN
jgi:hypothetical protein